MDFFLRQRSLAPCLAFAWCGQGAHRHRLLCNEESRTEAKVFRRVDLLSPVGIDVSKVLNIFEPRYIRLYNDMRSGIVDSERTTESSPMVFATWSENGGTSLAAIGVLLEIRDWQSGPSPQTNDTKPYYIATHHAGPRARLVRILNPEVGVDRSAYLVAEVEELDDTPGISNHASVLPIWRDVWKAFEKLIEAQELIDEKPRLTPAVLELRRLPGAVLSDRDVWRPAAVLQELHQRKIAAVHRKYRTKLINAHEGGVSSGPLELAYEFELEQLQSCLFDFVGLLQVDAGMELLQETLRLVNAEVQRLRVHEASESTAWSEAL